MDKKYPPVEIKMASVETNKEDVFFIVPRLSIRYKVNVIKRSGKITLWQCFPNHPW
jgi:hypothetical protein